MPRRVFSVDDESYTTTEAGAERAERTRELQTKRRAKNLVLLKTWRRRLKRATNEVRKRERRESYYAKVLGVEPVRPKRRPRRRRKATKRRTR